MRISGQHACIKATVDSTLRSFSRVGFRRLKFPPVLESRFEADTRRERCRRMRFEGLVAIGAFNLCLLLDFLLVKDVSWTVTVLRTAFLGHLRDRWSALCVDGRCPVLAYCQRPSLSDYRYPKG
jgi:hypothetical protein